jgi:hypothetical protein
MRLHLPSSKGFGKMAYGDWDNRIPEPIRKPCNFDKELHPMAEITNAEKNRSHRRLRSLNLILLVLIVLGLISLSVLLFIF